MIGIYAKLYIVKSVTLGTMTIALKSEQILNIFTDRRVELTNK